MKILSFIRAAVRRWLGIPPVFLPARQIIEMDMLVFGAIESLQQDTAAFIQASVSLQKSITECLPDFPGDQRDEIKDELVMLETARDQLESHWRTHSQKIKSTPLPPQ